MNLSPLSPDKLKKKLEESLLNNKIYIATLLILNIAYTLEKLTETADLSSILIASIPPAFLISLVITFARDQYIKNILMRRLMDDSYIPSVYRSNVDLRDLSNPKPLKKERAQTRQWMELNIFDRISSK